MALLLYNTTFEIGLVNESVTISRASSLNGEYEIDNRILQHKESTLQRAWAKNKKLEEIFLTPNFIAWLFGLDNYLNWSLWYSQVHLPTANIAKNHLGVHISEQRNYIKFG